MTDDERISFEERLAYAELARDNALAMRDEVRERLKDHRRNAGRMIGGLREIIVDLLLDVPPEKSKAVVERMRQILDAGKDRPSEAHSRSMGSC